MITQNLVSYASSESLESLTEAFHRAAGNHLESGFCLDMTHQPPYYHLWPIGKHTITCLLSTEKLLIDCQVEIELNKKTRRGSSESLKIELH